MSREPKIHCHDELIKSPFRLAAPIAWEPFADGTIRCTFCGSLNPLMVVDLFEKGVKISLDAADRKYGYLHKVYVNGIPCDKAGEEYVIGQRSGGEVTEMTPGAEFKATCNHIGCRQHGYWQVPIKSHHPAVLTGKLYLDHAKDLDAVQLDRFSKMLEHHLRVALWLSPEDGALMIGSPSMKGSSLPKGSL